MKKVLVFLVLVSISLSGCGKLDRVQAHFIGYSKICIDNVQYIQFSSGATLQRDTQGFVVQCKK